MKYEEYDRKYTQYSHDILTGKINACKYVKQACQRYLDFFEKYDFRPEKVDRVVNFISKLKHFTGKMNGKPFVLSDFQYWIVCNIYGFYNGENRVIKNVYIELARKNGKSFFAASLALYNMIGDGENNAEIELVANSTKQAKILFNICKNLVDDLDKKHKYFKCYRDNIRFDYTKSLLQVLSSDANCNDGWNSSMFIVDEYHSAANSSMYDVMKSSQGNRDNPLAVVITTSGFNLYSPCYEMRKTNIEILSGLKNDDTVFSAIYTLDDGDDWKNEDNFVKSNPNIDISVKRDYLREQVVQATNNTSMIVPILTKNFNVWCNSKDIWIDNDTILESSDKIDFNDFSGYNCYVGVDLASVSDMTAVSYMIPLDGKFYFFTDLYLPESCLDDTNSNCELYKRWKRMGLLKITPGNTTDYDFITADLLKRNNIVMIQNIAYDEYNSVQWAIDITEKGLPLVPYSQSLLNFNKPTKTFELLIKSGRIVIEDNEIIRWMFGNVGIKYDHNENMKPVKTSAQNKVDGVISMLEALGVYLSEVHYDNIVEII